MSSIVIGVLFPKDSAKCFHLIKIDIGFSLCVQTCLQLLHCCGTSSGRALPASDQVECLQVCERDDTRGPSAGEALHAQQLGGQGGRGPGRPSPREGGDGGEQESPEGGGGQEAGCEVRAGGRRQAGHVRPGDLHHHQADGLHIWRLLAGDVWPDLLLHSHGTCHICHIACGQCSS